MKKILSVEGMKCGHCKARVEQALRGVPGVKEVSVSLEKKTAAVTPDGTTAVDDAALRAAVEEAGFTVVGIEEKKGLFGR